MNRLLSLVSLIFIFLLSFNARGQEKIPPKALKAYERASVAFNSGQWTICEQELKKAIAEEINFPEPYIMLGDIYLETGKPEQAIAQYKKGLQLNPEKAYIVQILLANTLFELERYTEACQYYDTILNLTNAPANLKEIVKSKLNHCLTCKNLMENPVAFNPVNAGNGVNTPADEYINAISAEADRLFFTRRTRNTGDRSREFTESFYRSERIDNRWGIAAKTNFPPGSEDDAGALCISPDGRLLFYTACFRQDSYGSCDLYYSEKIGDAWTPARNMGAHINSGQWDAQPSLSPDGKTLYFASNRKGGLGSSDLWKTERNPDGNWSSPVNLGPVVNSPEAEMAPFIHYDNTTLYYSSSGHQGLGGLDLFRTVRTENGWSHPQNLGYPLNGKSDDLIIIVSPDAATGYISNNNLDGEGGFDIFEFELYPAIKPLPVTYFKGRVFDKEQNKPLQAYFELIDLDRDSLIIHAMSDPQNGEFLVCIPVNRNYALNVSCKGYLFYSQNFPLLELKTLADPYARDIFLDPVTEGNSLILRNVFFETDQFELLPASFTELDILVTFLRENPAIQVEIGGHTDHVGSDLYNIELSDKRAKTVFEYLVERDISPERLSFKGYGESQPVAANDTEDGRAMNRRTEVKIVRIE